jgi:hypothetical protein
MAQLGPSDYRSPSEHGAHENAEGIIDQVSELGARAETMAEELAAAIKERPYTTLAIAAGLAFAVGAIWKIGHRQPPTRIEALRARMPDMRGRMPELPNWGHLLPRSWR